MARRGRNVQDVRVFRSIAKRSPTIGSLVRLRIAPLGLGSVYRFHPQGVPWADIGSPRWGWGTVFRFHAQGVVLAGIAWPHWIVQPRRGGPAAAQGNALGDVAKESASPKGAALNERTDDRFVNRVDDTSLQLLNDTLAT